MSTTGSSAQGILRKTAFALGTILVSFFGFTIEPIILIPAFLLIGLVVSYIIYRYGFLGIKTLYEVDYEKMKEYHQYYIPAELHYTAIPKENRRFTGIIRVIILWNVLAILVNALSQLMSVYPPEIGQLVEILTWFSWIGLIIIIISWYSLLVHRLAKKQLPDQFMSILQGRRNTIVLGAGVLSYFIVCLWAIVIGAMSFPAVIAGLFILPVILLISRIEGKFFYIFTINLVFKATNWDVLAGQRVRDDKSKFSLFVGLIKQFLALLALVFVIISIITSLIMLIDLILGNIGIDNPSILKSIAAGFFTAGNYEIFLLLLTLGPLLALVSKPFEFVETWMNQGLYELLSSSWDIKFFNDHMDKYRTLYRFASNVPGFRVNLFLSIAAILTSISVRFCSSLVTVDNAFFVIIKEIMIVISIVNVIIFLITLVELSVDLREEKTYLIFAVYGREYGVNLVNWSLYGYYIMYRRWKEGLEEYFELTPDEWGIAHYLKGVTEMYSDEERLEAFKAVTKEGTVALPHILEFSFDWSIDALLIAKKTDEAIQTCEKAVERKVNPLYFLRKLVDIYYSLNDLAKIEEVNKRILEYNSTDSSALNGLSYAYIGQDKFDEADEYLQKAMKRRSKDPDFWSNLGVLLKRRGKYKEAEKIFKKALKRDPSYDVSYQNLGNLYLSQKRYEEAEQSYNKALINNENNFVALYQLGMLYKEKNLYSKSEETLIILYSRVLEDDDPENKFLTEFYQVIDEISKVREMQKKPVEEQKLLQEAEKVFEKLVAKYRKSAQPWKVLAGIYERLDKKETAMLAYQTAYELDKKDMVFNINYGTFLLRNGKLAEAEEMFQLVMSKEPFNVDIMFRMGRVLVEQSRLSEAENVFRTLLKYSPRDTASILELSTLWRDQQRFTEAVEFFKVLLERDETNADAWYALGNTFEWQEKIVKAEEAYYQAIRFAPGDSYSWYSYGTVLERQGKIDEALMAYKKVTAPEYIVGTRLHLGTMLMEHQRLLEAEEAFKSILEVEPSSVDALANLGVIYTNQGRYDEAEDYLKKAVKLESFAEGWSRLGALYLSKGAFRDSLEPFRKAIELDESNALYRINYGITLANLKLYTEAEEALNKAVELDASNYFAWLHLGDLHFNQKRYDKAANAFNRALEINPDDFASLTSYGAALMRLERYQEALELTKRAVELNPGSAIGWYNHGWIMFHLGHKEDAFELWNKAIQLDPNNGHFWASLAVYYSDKEDVSNCSNSLKRAFDLDPSLVFEVKTEKNFDKIRSSKTFQDLISQYDQSASKKDEDH